MLVFKMALELRVILATADKRRIYRDKWFQTCKQD